MVPAAKNANDESPFRTSRLAFHSLAGSSIKSMRICVANTPISYIGVSNMIRPTCLVSSMPSDPTSAPFCETRIPRTLLFRTRGESCNVTEKTSRGARVEIQK